MGLFTKLASKKQASAAPKSKGMTWLCGDPQSLAIGQSVHELVLLDAQAKAVSAKMDIHKTVVKKFAEEHYFRDYANLQVPPGTPMVVQNADGEKVTYVTQDRSSQYPVKEEQQDALKQLLGDGRADELLFTETTFAFNRDVLSKAGVLEVVEKAIEGAIKKLTTGDDPALTPEEAEQLLEVKQKTAFKPNTFDRLTMICGQDVTRMKAFADIAGSCFVRYVRT